MLNKNYLLKAERRLETAKFAFEKGYICSAVSNCYYALFNLMQAVVEEAPGGSWTHGGLPKVFTKVVFQEALLPKEKIKGIVDFSDRLYAFERKQIIKRRYWKNQKKQRLIFHFIFQ